MNFRLDTHHLSRYAKSKTRLTYSLNDVQSKPITTSVQFKNMLKEGITLMKKLKT
jgi:hypothetical protein